MAIEKRHKRVWNGLVWVDVYHPTSADLVVMASGDTLEDAFDELAGDLQDHTIDVSVHVSSTDRTKLDNLSLDANGEYANKTAFQTHEGDSSLHKTSGDTSKLANLAANADSTYATKAELAGATEVYVVADITERDNLSGMVRGAQAWVRDPSDDTSLTKEGTAVYIWDGTAWNFAHQFTEDFEVIHDWGDVINKPAVLEDANLPDLEEAVTNRHTHSNKTLLDTLSLIGGGTRLAYNGVEVGNKITMTLGTGPAPTNPQIGDIWLPEVS